MGFVYRNKYKQNKATDLSATVKLQGDVLSLYNVVFKYTTRNCVDYEIKDRIRKIYVKYM